MGCGICRPRRPAAPAVDLPISVILGPAPNPFTPFNTQLLVSPQDIEQHNKRMRDARKHFYVDEETCEFFIDVRIPIYKPKDDGSLMEVDELCLPFTVLDLDESLPSTLHRLRHEAQDILSAEQLERANERRLVFCDDRGPVVLYQETLADAKDTFYLWHMYMCYNDQNLARRPRPMYGKLPAPEDSEPIDTRPIIVRWEIVDVDACVRYTIHSH